MAMDEKKRQRISILGSLGFHLIVAILIGATGLFSFTTLNHSDIFEVTAVNSGGGDNSPGIASDAEPEQVAAPEQQAFTPEQIGSDAILEHSDTSKTNVTYEQLENLQKEEQSTDANDKPVIAPKPAISPGTSTGGNGSNLDNADKGTGSGSETGSSEGTGSGEGNGSGSMKGEATDEIVSSPAEPPIPTKRVQPKYPQSALSAGVSGTVTVKFLIGKDGSVESATVSGSSGSDALDQAALSSAYGWHFIPAKDEWGRPVRCYARAPISFNIAD